MYLRSMQDQLAATFTVFLGGGGVGGGAHGLYHISPQQQHSLVLEWDGGWGGYLYLGCIQDEPTATLTGFGVGRQSVCAQGV